MALILGDCLFGIVIWMGVCVSSGRGNLLRVLSLSMALPTDPCLKIYFNIDDVSDYNRPTGLKILFESNF